MFTDLLALVTWLLQHSSPDVDFSKDAATANVFSRGLRSGIRGSRARARSRQLNEAPCGADGAKVKASFIPMRGQETISAAFQISPIVMSFIPMRGQEVRPGDADVRQGGGRHLSR